MYTHVLKGTNAPEAKSFKPVQVIVQIVQLIKFMEQENRLNSQGILLSADNVRPMIVQQMSKR
jgi:hypothetical protein